jgi:hypothetical protein
LHLHNQNVKENTAMSYRRRHRFSKRELLGSLHVDYLLSVTDLGLMPGANRWEVLAAFLARGEARAERLVEDLDGFLILQSIPGRPNTGAIYVYRESLRAFFWLTFGNREDDLDAQDFQNALRVHRLIRMVADVPKGRRRNRRQRHHLPKPVAASLVNTKMNLSIAVPVV